MRSDHKIANSSYQDTSFFNFGKFGIAIFVLPGGIEKWFEKEGKMARKSGLSVQKRLQAVLSLLRKKEAAYLIAGHQTVRDLGKHLVSVAQLVP